MGAQFGGIIWIVVVHKCRLIFMANIGRVAMKLIALSAVSWVVFGLGVASAAGVGQIVGS